MYNTKTMLDKNKRAIELLAEEINKQRLIIFAGAGCSSAAGLPSWDQVGTN